MTIQIHYFTNNFSKIASIDVSMANTTSMTISHFAGVTKSTMATLPFIIEGVSTHVPFIKDPEFCVVVRKKIDLTAIGPDSNIIKNIGKDIGKYNYTNNVPTNLKDIPPGFKELYKG